MPVVNWGQAFGQLTDLRALILYELPLHDQDITHLTALTNSTHMFT